MLPRIHKVASKRLRLARTKTVTKVNMEARTLARLADADVRLRQVCKIIKDMDIFEALQRASHCSYLRRGRHPSSSAAMTAMMKKRNARRRERAAPLVRLVLLALNECPVPLARNLVRSDGTTGLLYHVTPDGIVEAEGATRTLTYGPVSRNTYDLPFALMPLHPPPDGVLERGYIKVHMTDLRLSMLLTRLIALILCRRHRGDHEVPENVWYEIARHLVRSALTFEGHLLVSPERYQQLQSYDLLRMTNVKEYLP